MDAKEIESIEKRYFINLSNATNVFKPAPQGIWGIIYDYFRPRRV